MDLSKVFDALDHAVHFDKLKACGVQGLSHSWIESYITSRSHGAKINGVMPGSIDVKCGAPHGSILAPLLLLTDTDDISNHIVMVLYADDCTYLLPTKNPDASLDKVARDLDQ